MKVAPPLGAVSGDDPPNWNPAGTTGEMAVPATGPPTTSGGCACLHEDRLSGVVARAGSDVCRESEVISGVATFGQIEEDQPVAERISHHRESSDGDVFGLSHRAAPGLLEGGYGLGDRGDQPGGPGQWSDAQHELGLGVRQPEPGLPDAVVPPDQIVPEATLVKGQALFQVWNSDHHGVDHAKYLAVGHGSYSTPVLQPGPYR